jgi:hypothetical protein
MSRPTLTLVFSARAFFAFSRSSLFKIVFDYVFYAFKGELDKFPADCSLSFVLKKK